MNKSYKYTFLTVLLTIVFVIGSIAGMNLILRTRERQLLTERGRAVVDAPVQAWQTQENGEEGGSDEKADYDRYILTTGQIEEVIRYWNERTEVTIHNPVNGQISMEEAVKAGEEWITEIIEENGKEDTESYFMNATLGVGIQKKDMGEQLEPYYSFWIVQFSNQYMNTVLYVNAITGKVWSAEITLYEDFPEKIPYEKLKRFVELSGMQASDTEVVKNKEGTKGILQVEYSSLYAEIEFRHSQTGLPNDKQEMFYKENVIINFKLTVSQNPEP